MGERPNMPVFSKGDGFRIEPAECVGCVVIRDRSRGDPNVFGNNLIAAFATAEEAAGYVRHLLEAIVPLTPEQEG